VTVLYLPREVFFGRLDFAGVFVPVCASDFGRFCPATSGSFRLMCSRWDTSDRGYPVPVRFAMTWPAVEFARRTPSRVVPLMWLLGRGLFRPFGPVGLLIAAYRIWRRVPEARKREIKRRARALAGRVSGGVFARSS
jgi:hypothetical protein